MPIGKYSPHSSSKEVFLCNGDYYRKTTTDEMWRKWNHVMPGINLYAYNTTPALKVQGSLQKRGQNDCKSQRTNGVN